MSNRLLKDYSRSSNNQLVTHAQFVFIKDDESASL